MAFKEGDKLWGLVNNGDGWWVGEHNKRKGMFPANYCRVCELHGGCRRPRIVVSDGSRARILSQCRRAVCDARAQEASGDEAKQDMEAGGARVELTEVQLQQIRKINRAPLPKLPLAYGAWGYHVRCCC